MFYKQMWLGCSCRCLMIVRRAYWQQRQGEYHELQGGKESGPSDCCGTPCTVSLSCGELHLHCCCLPGVSLCTDELITIAL